MLLPELEHPMSFSLISVENAQCFFFISVSYWLNNLVNNYLSVIFGKHFLRSVSFCLSWFVAPGVRTVSLAETLKRGMIAHRCILPG